MRLKMQESPLFTRLKAAGQVSKNPLKESFGNRKNLRYVLLALFGATAGQGVVWYTGQFYALTFLQKPLNLDWRLAYRWSRSRWPSERRSSSCSAGCRIASAASASCSGAACWRR